MTFLARGRIAGEVVGEAAKAWPGFDSKLAKATEPNPFAV